MNNNYKMNNNKIEIVYNHQLRYKKYDIVTLEYNIDRLCLRTLLTTQKLTPEFCVKYILNDEEHGMCVEDSYLFDEDILKFQEHITQKDLYDIYSSDAMEDNIDSSDNSNNTNDDPTQDVDTNMI